MNILVIRLSSLGDVVLTTAAVRCIRNKYPDAQIDFLVGKPYADLLKYNPHISDVIHYDKTDVQYNEIIKAKLAKDYHIIDWQDNHRSAKFRRKLGKVVAKLPHRRFQKLALVYLKKNLFDGTNIAELYINIISKLGVTNDNKGLEVWLPEDERHSYLIECYHRPIEHNKLIVGIAPGARHKTKQWLPEYFAKLMLMLSEQYEAEFHILGDDNDINIGKDIASNCMELQVHNHCGETQLLDSIRIIDRCHIFITNDSALMHLAAARHVPIVSIFGATVSNFGFVPYKTPYQICEVPMKCRPCSHIGKETCKYGHFNCMRMVEPSMVLDGINKLISNL